MSAASVTAIYCILCKRLLGNRCRCRKDSYCEFVTVNMHMSLGVSLAVWIVLLSTGICSEILKKTVLFVWTPVMCFHLFIYWFVVCCHLRQRGNVFTLLVCVSDCLFVCFSVNKITQKVMEQFWVSERIRYTGYRRLDFLDRSGSGPGSRISFSIFPTRRDGTFR